MGVWGYYPLDGAQELAHHVGLLRLLLGEAEDLHYLLLRVKNPQLLLPYLMEETEISVHSQADHLADLEAHIFYRVVLIDFDHNWLFPHSCSHIYLSLFPFQLLF